MIRVVGGVGTFNAVVKSSREGRNGFILLLFHSTEFSTSETDGYGVNVEFFHCSNEGFIAFGRAFGRVIAGF